MNTHMRRDCDRRKTSCSALIVLSLISMFAAPVWAQHANGYVFFAPGGATCCGQTIMTLHTGVGGEDIIGKGIGVGVEVGVLAAREDIEASATGIGSVNGYYHFRHAKEDKLDPFVTGGYTIGWRQGYANFGNFGGGVNYWMSNHFGARLEFRDHLHTEDGSTLQYWGFRFGLAFH